MELSQLAGGFGPGQKCFGRLRSRSSDTTGDVFPLLSLGCHDSGGPYILSIQGSIFSQHKLVFIVSGSVEIDARDTVCCTFAGSRVALWI
jgi:hypothetical protein